MSCPFCEIETDRIVAENTLAIALRDGFPVNPGHTLIVTRRHAATWFEVTNEERQAILDLVDRLHTQLVNDFSPDGFNIGINVGAAAGQTVMHLHVHVIPRYRGDVNDPTGGVRFVIPSKGNYRRPGFIPGHE